MIVARSLNNGLIRSEKYANLRGIGQNFFFFVVQNPKFGMVGINIINIDDTAVIDRRLSTHFQRNTINMGIK